MSQLEASFIVVHPPIFQMVSPAIISSNVPVASCVSCGAIRPVEFLGECASCGSYLCGMNGCKSTCVCESSEIPALPAGVPTSITDVWDSLNDLDALVVDKSSDLKRVSSDLKRVKESIKSLSKDRG